jgi:hypothetical protein
MSQHPHDFLPGEWPFDDPTNVAAISSRPVIEEGHPILLVTHDEDGDWQILCGTTNASADQTALADAMIWRSSSADTLLTADAVDTHRERPGQHAKNRFELEKYKEFVRTGR